jgi:hypothetical protein
MTKHETPPGLHWKSLGAGQLLLFLFSLLAFIDMQSKIEQAMHECGCAKFESFEDFEEVEREKRSLKGDFCLEFKSMLNVRLCLKCDIEKFHLM